MFLWSNSIKGSLQHPLIEGCQSIKRIIWASLVLPDFVVLYIQIEIKQFYSQKSPFEGG